MDRPLHIWKVLIVSPLPDESLACAWDGTFGQRALYFARLINQLAQIGAAAFAAAWTEGQAMTLEQAIESALTEELRTE